MTSAGSSQHPPASGIVERPGNAADEILVRAIADLAVEIYRQRKAERGAHARPTDRPNRPTLRLAR